MAGLRYLHFLHPTSNSQQFTIIVGEWKHRKKREKTSLFKWKNLGPVRLEWQYFKNPRFGPRGPPGFQPVSRSSTLAQPLVGFMVSFFSPRETESNSFILFASFQQREGQRIETQISTFVNFVWEKRGRRGKNSKNYPFLNLANCTGKTEWWESPMSKVSAAETGSENWCEDIKISVYSGNRTRVHSTSSTPPPPLHHHHLYTTTTSTPPPALHHHQLYTTTTTLAKFMVSYKKGKRRDGWLTLHRNFKWIFVWNSWQAFEKWVARRQVEEEWDENLKSPKVNSPT